MDELLLSQRLPVLALRGLNVFPGLTVHFDVGRKKSIRAVEEAMRCEQEIFLVTQKNIQVDDPEVKDLYTVGTVSVVKQVLRLPGDTLRILVEGKYRATMVECLQAEPYIYGRVESISDLSFNKNGKRTEALLRQVSGLYEQFLDLSGRGNQESMMQISEDTDPGFVADYIAQNTSINYTDKQRVLEQLHPLRRLELVCVLLGRELDVMHLEAEIQEKVQENVSRGQRDYYLREQLKVIQAELGEDDEGEEIQRYDSAIRELKLDAEIEEKLLKEVQRLRKQPPNSQEAAVIRTYLDTCLELPWNVRSKERVDIRTARKVL